MSEASVCIAFELLVPAHLSMLQDEGITLDFPQKSVLMNFRAKKLARLDPSILYGPQKSTLLYSLEGFIGRINFDKVQHHLTLGSQMGSPSSTAAYLMNCSSWDIRAEIYLRDAIANGAGHGCGSVTARQSLRNTATKLNTSRSICVTVGLPDQSKTNG
ncbi:MAG: hypothetical protein Q9194_001215 [Teloschistes cf. exilis]